MWNILLLPRRRALLSSSLPFLFLTVPCRFSFFHSPCFLQSFFPYLANFTQSSFCLFRFPLLSSSFPFFLFIPPSHGPTSRPSRAAWWVTVYRNSRSNRWVRRYINGDRYALSANSSYLLSFFSIHLPEAALLFPILHFLPVRPHDIPFP